MTRTAAANPVVPDDAEICRRLGKRIRELRKERGLTQQALAERASGRTSSKHVGAVERGRSNPSATLLVRIAQALEVAVGDLFSTITPGQPPRLPRRKITIVREYLRSINDFVDSLDRPPAPPETAAGYEVQRSGGAPRRLRSR